LLIKTELCLAFLSLWAISLTYRISQAISLAKIVSGCVWSVINVIILIIVLFTLLLYLLLAIVGGVVIVFVRFVRDIGSIDFLILLI